MVVSPIGHGLLMSPMEDEISDSKPAGMAGERSIHLGFSYAELRGNFIISSFTLFTTLSKGK